MMIDRNNVVKFPDSIDADIMLENVISNKNMTCPFCGETKEYTFMDYLKPYNERSGVEDTGICTSWYGRHDEPDFPSLRHFIYSIFHPEKYHHWKQKHFECHTCGARWKSEPFRTDIMNDVKIHMNK